MTIPKDYIIMKYYGRIFAIHPEYQEEFKGSYYFAHMEEKWWHPKMGWQDKWAPPNAAIELSEEV